jgi:hypothetical protein
MGFQAAFREVVLTLHRHDILAVTTPMGEAIPALKAGDVRMTERGDDIEIHDSHCAKTSRQRTW